MASWLPETLFEIVGQGPAPSKDYYQLLVTRSQASARRGLPSLTPGRPGGARKASRARPRATVARRKRPVPAPSREDFPRHLGLLGRLLCGPRLFSQPQPGSSLASFLCLPTSPPSPFLPPGAPTRRVPSARREKQASLAGVQPHLSVGRRERKTQPSVPRRSRQGRGEREDLFSRVGANHGGFLKSHCGLSGTTTTSKLLYL